jgi:hypothetical protein
MIRMIIRVFLAVEARRPQRPSRDYPWWDVMSQGVSTAAFDPGPSR